MVSLCIIVCKVAHMGNGEIEASKNHNWGASLLVGYLGVKINLPLFFDEGCAAFPLYLAGKYMYPYLKKNNE